MQHLSNLFKGHSQAGYSSWFLYQPDRLLLDCGEGCATTLHSQAFAVQRLLISHGHQDHIAGLPTFCWARGFGAGEKKPLTIHYPVGDKQVEGMRTYLDCVFGELPFEVRWEPLTPGDGVPLNQNRYLETFQTTHEEGRLTMGYRVVEKRKKLKVELTRNNALDIRDRVRAGEDLYDVVEVCPLTYTGDTVPLSPEVFKPTDLLMHECTFLEREDVKRGTHSVLEDVMKLAVNINPKQLFLFHFSIRYSPAQVNKAVKKWCEENQVEFEVWVQCGRHLWQVTG